MVVVYVIVFLRWSQSVDEHFACCISLKCRSTETPRNMCGREHNILWSKRNTRQGAERVGAPVFACTMRRRFAPTWGTCSSCSWKSALCKVIKCMTISCTINTSGFSQMNEMQLSFPEDALHAGQ